MSSVCILTPIVIGSWPSIVSAVMGAVSAMGFSVVTTSVPQTASEESVVTEVANSQVLTELLAQGQKIAIQREGIRLEIGVDGRGKCSVCASGKGVSKAQLRKISEAFSGRIVQQFAYHKLITELKARGFSVENESVAGDESIQVRVRMDG